MEAYFVDWLNLLLRWLHLIAGIAWIGASFYFVMLDNSLSRPKKPEDATRGVSGELWAVHGGGFYCSQKYLTGPKGEPLSENLHWSKWEAYTTWLSGMGLLAIIYWWGASSYLIDKNVLTLSPAVAVAISIANTEATASAPNIQSHSAGMKANVSTMKGIAATIWRGPVAVPPPHETIDSPYDALNRIMLKIANRTTKNSARNARR